MRSTYLIAGAIVLALVAAGVLFGTDFFRKNPFHTPTEEELLVTQITEAASSGGGVAVTFAARDARLWQLAGGHKLERFSLDGGDAVFARLTSSAPLDPHNFEWPSQGLSVAFPATLNNKSNGLTIEIGIVARRTNARSPGEVAIVYATRQAGNTGWTHLQLTDRFQLKTFTYKVPKVERGYNSTPVLAINADPAGNGGSVEILGVLVRIVAPSHGS